MLSRQEIDKITAHLCEQLADLFPETQIEALLFGSYARGDMESGSDVDLLILVDSPRKEILEKSWQIGNIAGDLLIEHGFQVSPIVENRNWFQNNADVIPLFRNILREGTQINV